MGKSEGFLTPKAIANRIKAAGLQKLRWYCQMCQKQCRDENGFKCHCMSESHQRQMRLFQDRPKKFLDSFSQEFETEFLEVLKRRFGSKRVHANLVYQEYISDRHHIHMNATIWESLTVFVKYLGKTGKCVVDETPKGWYIQYINRDPEVIKKQEALAKKEKADLDDEERMKMIIERRIAETQKLAQSPEESQSPVEAQVDSSEPIKFSLGSRKPDPAANPTTIPTPETTTSNTNTDIKQEPVSPSSDAPIQPKVEPNRASDHPISPLGEPSTSTALKFSLASNGPTPVPSPSSSSHSKSNDKKRKPSAVEELMMEQERQKEKRNRKDYWITPGIVVKIMNKNLANGKYYKQKGIVQEVIDRYIAQIKILDLGDVLRVDQSQLETVLPSVGGKMKIVNGAYRGESCVLMGLDIDNFAAKVKLVSGPNSGRIIPDIAYEDICKLAQ
jgi:DNA/RNA-binding protein KIN17